MAIHLTDILDLPVVQSMLDSLWLASGIPMGLIDADGEVLITTGWQKLCTDFHRKHPEIKSRCILNHPELSSAAAGGDPADTPRQFTCSSGLVDIVLPIHCGGEYLGMLFLGQFLDRPPDPEFYRRFAAQLGFDQEEYLALLDEVPVIPREKIDHFLAFYEALICLLSESGLSKLREEESRKSLVESERALRESEERFRSIVQATPLGIHMYQCQADGRLIFVGCNPAADAILGIDNRQFLGKELLEAFPALAGTEVPDRYRQVCADGEPWQAEQVAYADGKIAGVFEVHAFRTGPNRIAIVFMDIGERHRALEEIRSREATLHSLLRAAPLCIGLSHNRVFGWVNHWMLEELGYGEEELIGRSSRILYENDDEYARVGLVRAGTVDLGSMGEIETRWLCRDGRAIDVLLRFMPIDPEDQAMGVIFTALNISTAKRAAGELREREERIRLLLESSGEAIYGADLEGRCIFVNPMCLELLGYHTESELLGRRLHDLIDCAPGEDPCYRETECRIFPALRNGESVHVVGETFRRSDGSSFPVEYWSSPLLKAGDVIGTVINFIDITERHQAEQRLREALAETQRAREQVNAILRSAADALIVIDPHGLILMANPAAIELLGSDPDRIVGTRIVDELPDPHFLERIEQAIAGRVTSLVFDLNCWHDPHGRERIVQARIASIRELDQGLYGVVAILRDVTREREIDRLKDDFISTAAHELRTPITSILGYTEIMLAQLEKLTAAQLREYLSVVCKRTEALTQIITEMLDLSRLQAGQAIHFNLTPDDLAGMAREVLGQCQMTLPDHHFVLEVDEGLPLLEFDAAKLQQVFDNLLSNAVKFSPRGSRVTIAVVRQGNEVLTSVIDQGVGMTPDQVERVFDKFYRADASATAVSGLGLGMSLVKGIVEAHGGRIWVASAIGQGTTVTFSLPAAHCPEA